MPPARRPASRKTCDGRQVLTGDFGNSTHAWPRRGTDRWGRTVRLDHPLKRHRHHYRPRSPTQRPARRGRSAVTTGPAMTRSIRSLAGGGSRTGPARGALRRRPPADSGGRRRSSPALLRTVVPRASCATAASRTNLLDTRPGQLERRRVRATGRPRWSGRLSRRFPLRFAEPRLQDGHHLPDAGSEFDRFAKSLDE